MQIEEIFNEVATDKTRAQLLLTPIIFDELINIVNKDTTILPGPTEEQLDLRTKIIMNELAREEAKTKGEEIENKDLPFQISKDEFREAIKLSPMEQAERNKEYGILCLAVLAKLYSEDFEKQTGNVIQITDMPGASDIVKVLKNDENPGLQHTAMDALTFLYRPEYEKEMKAIFKIVSNNPNEGVAKHAEAVLNAIDKL